MGISFSPGFCGTFVEAPVAKYAVNGAEPQVNMKSAPKSLLAKK